MMAGNGKRGLAWPYYSTVSSSVADRMVSASRSNNKPTDVHPLLMSTPVSVSLTPPPFYKNRKFKTTAISSDGVVTSLPRRYYPRYSTISSTGNCAQAYLASPPLPPRIQPRRPKMRPMSSDSTDNDVDASLLAHRCCSSDVQLVLLNKQQQMEAAAASSSIRNRTRRKSPISSESSSASTSSASFRPAQQTLSHQSNYVQIRSFEILKRPGQNLGFYLRGGNGINRNAGIFVSRIAKSSPLSKFNLIRPGDEILAVNSLTTSSMQIEECVYIISVSSKLLITVRSAPSVQPGPSLLRRLSVKTRSKSADDSKTHLQPVVPIKQRQSKNNSQENNSPSLVRRYSFVDDKETSGATTFGKCKLDKRLSNSSGALQAAAATGSYYENYGENSSETSSDDSSLMAVARSAHYRSGGGTEPRRSCEGGQRSWWWRKKTSRNRLAQPPPLPERTYLKRQQQQQPPCCHHPWQGHHCQCHDFICCNTCLHHPQQDDPRITDRPSFKNDCSSDGGLSSDFSHHLHQISSSSRRSVELAVDRKPSDDARPHHRYIQKRHGLSGSSLSVDKPSSNSKQTTDGILRHHPSKSVANRNESQSSRVIRPLLLPFSPPSLRRAFASLPRQRSSASDDDAAREAGSSAWTDDNSVHQSRRLMMHYDGQDRSNGENVSGDNDQTPQMTGEKSSVDMNDTSIFKSTSNTTSRKVFGVKLAHLVETEALLGLSPISVPVVVQLCIRRINASANSSGLYSRQSDVSKRQELKATFERIVSLSHLSRLSNQLLHMKPSIVSDFLMDFLKALPQPLFNQHQTLQLHHLVDCTGTDCCSNQPPSMHISAEQPAASSSRSDQQTAIDAAVLTSAAAITSAALTTNSNNNSSKRTSTPASNGSSDVTTRQRNLAVRQFLLSPRLPKYAANTFQALADHIFVLYSNKAQNGMTLEQLCQVFCSVIFSPIFNNVSNKTPIDDVNDDSNQLESVLFIHLCRLLFAIADPDLQKS